MKQRVPRFSVDQLVRVRAGDECQVVAALNVSLTGACLVGLRGVLPEAPVTAHHRKLRIETKVAWSGGAVTGVQFLEPLDPADLKAFSVVMEGSLGEKGSPFEPHHA